MFSSKFHATEKLKKKIDRDLHLFVITPH